jgi:hypothetical protein
MEGNIDKALSRSTFCTEMKKVLSYVHFKDKEGEA